MNIQQAWCKSTSSDPDWSEGNPALGQCAVTTLVVQDLLGGGIIRAETSVDGKIYGSHYWNVLDSGFEIDLTRIQFGPDVELVNESYRDREYLLSHPDTAERYRILRGRIDNTPEKVRGDVHHLVQPVIGMLRLGNISSKDIDYFVRRLYAALAIVDSSVGEGPTREELAHIYKDLGIGL